VISGPNWTLGPPGTFSHTIVSADGNHAIRSAVDPCDDEGCYPSFAQSSPISPIGCTSGGPPAGYVHAGTFAYVSGTTDEAVSMKVESDMSLIPSTAYDHVQATVAIQNGGATLYNWLEAGIGVFGDRNVNPFYTPHYWAYYQPSSGNGTFWDLGQADSFTHRFEIQQVGSGTWQLFIDSHAKLPSPVALQDVEWMTVFNEDHNQTNGDCDRQHVTYTSSTHAMSTYSDGDLPYDPFSSTNCHRWNGYHNWEIYWQSDTSIYCVPGGGAFEPDRVLGLPPGFPVRPGS
jgi:hypothetical protein